MPAFPSFRSVVELWDTRDACAAEIGGGVSPSQVSKWWQRDSIPPEFWSAILGTDKAETSGLNSEILTMLASRRREVVEAVEARA